MELNILIGALCGVAAGIIMALVSELAFGLRLFKSSILLIDGSFLFTYLKKDVSQRVQRLTGLAIHLVTSALFGGIYTVITELTDLPSLSMAFITLYVLILYLSMLVIALPIAGQGFFGRKGGQYAWIEQFILHVVFAVDYYIALSVFGG